MFAADGTYTVSYTPTLAGAYTVAVRIGGVAIINSPFAVTVAKGTHTHCATLPSMCYSRLAIHVPF